ncbi:radical SAM protein, partial [bacterium]|nr:radical SAM protein [bacterium]
MSELKSFLKRLLKVNKLQDNGLNKITCIRYTMTWRCNFKCVSCNIWQMKTFKEKELSPEDIDKFTKNALLKDVKEIVISGGEPILRDDFPEVILAFHKNLKKARFAITTNGYDPQRTYEFFKKIKTHAPDLKWGLIGVSLNGPKDIHDKSRGIPGSYEKVLETAELLKEFSEHVEF